MYFVVCGMLCGGLCLVSCGPCVNECFVCVVCMLCIVCLVSGVSVVRRCVYVCVCMCMCVYLLYLVCVGVGGACVYMLWVCAHS